MYQARGTLNETRIMGHLGQDPQVKYTQTGTCVCVMSIATTVKIPNGRNAAGELQYREKTNWFRTVLFGKNAEFWETRVKKGDYIHIKGVMMQKTYERPADGAKIYYWELYAETVQQLGKKTTTSVTQEELDLIPPADVAPEATFEIKPEEVQPGFAIQ